MVPTSYYDFFAACATVAGALIGLLFVAVSISPDKITGAHASIEHRLRAGGAFSALINALVISLIALLPGEDIGVSAISVAGVGLASTIALAIAFYQNRQGRLRLSQLLLIVTPHVLYALELINGIGLQRPGTNVGDLGNQGSLMIAFFVYAIARAWEMVGATGPSLVATVAGMALGAVHREEPEAGPPEADDPGQE